MKKSTPHSFHIPVMGTGFTIDSPIKIARFGISSVVSLVDDVLIEQMRKYHCQAQSEPYEEIDGKSEDFRARRITAYLDLMHRLVTTQIDNLRRSSFDEENDLTRYFKMLPDTQLKQDYNEMLACSDADEKARRQEDLKARIVPGGIDVNIMTKLDRDIYRGGEKLPAMFGDAMSALRGFARSTLDSAIIFSAGINARLYNYMSEFDDFFPDSAGDLKKRIILKVSDYRSAVIQGKYMAKRGLWVSEFRIESGLNCGGHAFATNGYLIGPILDEFKQKRDELLEALHKVYGKALGKVGRVAPASPCDLRITVQGGIGTAAEDRFLQHHYNVDGTGWGTPFMLVPEAANLDGDHLEKLCRATEGDIFLSSSSPMGVPFWNLRKSASEEERRRRIKDGKPGSPCPKGYISVNDEFTKVPVCVASRSYLRPKLAQLDKEAEQSGQDLMVVRENVLAKSCICHDLAGAATLPLGIDSEAKPAICAGPNIVSFKKIATLEEMLDHIYGRINSLVDPDRPHMFIRELGLYIDYFKAELERVKADVLPATVKSLDEFKENLLDGIDYYQQLAEQFVDDNRQRFLEDLRKMRESLELITVG